MTGAARLWLWCPLRFEFWAAKRGGGQAQVSRSGKGPKRSQAFVAELANTRQLYGTVKAQTQVVILGLGGGLQDGGQPGDVIVASQVMTPDDPHLFEFPQASQLAEALLAQGLPARTGMVCSSERVVQGKARRTMASSGAAVVDMESWWLLQATYDTAATAAANAAATEAAATAAAVVPVPLAVIRVLLDTNQKSLWRSVFGLKSILGMVAKAGAAIDPLALSNMTTRRTLPEMQP